MILSLLLFLFISTGSVGVVSAGSFKVFPLKLELDKKTKTTLFKITNTGDTSVTIQLETVSWFQNDQGDDKYQPTNDIVYFPKIVKVDSGEQRIIRIGYRGSALESSEKTYRIFAQELPELGEKKGAVKFSLRFSVPIFVHVQGTAAKVTVESAKLSNGRLHVVVENSGSEHFVVKSIDVNGLSYDGKQTFLAKSGGWYVLPDTNKSFFVKLPENECRLSEKLSLKVETSAGSYDKLINIDGGECVAVTRVDNSKNALSFEQ